MCCPSTATQQLLESLGWTDGVDFSLKPNSMPLSFGESVLAGLDEDESWVIKKINGKAVLNKRIFEDVMQEASKTPFRRSV